MLESPFSQIASKFKSHRSQIGNNAQNIQIIQTKRRRKRFW